MKKTLIALAAVAATGAAFAQSSVTLSGTVDTGIERVKATDGTTLTKMGHSRSGTSNWTLSGSEDLGGGLKANFKVSTAFASDDGTATSVTSTNANGFGNNDMFVELAGGFGSVKLGRSVNPVFSHALTANGTKGVTGFASVGNSLDSMNVYVPNQLMYTTPNMSGFTAQVSYAPSEVDGAKAHTALGLRYAAGPLVVTLASGNEFAEAQVAPNQLVSGAFKNKNVNQIAAAYDFGVARALFTFQDNGNLASDSDTAYVLGVTAPVGPGVLWAQYGVAEAAADDSKIFSMGYKYMLSKRTTVYAQYGTRNVSAAGFAAANPIKTNGFGLGVQHNF